MERAFHLPGIFVLFCSFVLLFLVSVSLPFIDPLDYVRVYIYNGIVTTTANGTAISEIRFGLWANCRYEIVSGHRVCSSAADGYTTTLYTNGGASEVTVGSSWTRGLVAHPIATGVSLLALLLSFFTHPTITFLTYVLAFLAFLIALVAFFADVALYAYVQRQIRLLPDVSAGTRVEAAFIMTIVAVVLLFLAGFSIWLGRRRARMAGATSYKMPSNRVRAPRRVWNWRRPWRGRTRARA
ncbi:hypothetical protein BKA93DRAFT_822060 [Sparassis latifolia]|uniref:Pali-domain-containing protein n=1 Tax=Sparassis crispa TaxID=139825 RepID=A0A401GXS9_9APHY|nr:hypothetical protein SCP_1002480 [Sparassis crispa]GBE87002.1 hypothetical protein SCP_1002480 [Sparassis crispa]